MNIERPELIEALARRFVLGTMSPRARRRFSLWVDERPAVEDVVLKLEADLSPMGWSLPVERPSDLVWRRVAARIASVASAPKDSTASTPSRATGWRLAAGAFALAFLAMTAAWWQSSTRETAVTVAADPDAGIIQDDQGNAIWLVQLYDAQGRASVRVQTPPTAQAANDYQLWVLRDDGVPVSLGLLPQDGEVSLALSAAALDGLRRGTTLAVSLEPLGGSPKDVPTGPVLFTAPIVGG